MKKQLPHLLVTTIFFLFISTGIFAQIPDPLSHNLPDNTDWKPLFQQQGISVQYTVSICNGKDQIWLKATNRNARLTVSKFLLSSNQDNLKIPIIISLEPGVEKNFNCNSQELLPELNLFHAVVSDLQNISAQEIKIDTY